MDKMLAIKMFKNLIANLEQGNIEIDYAEGYQDGLEHGVLNLNITGTPKTSEELELSHDHKNQSH